MIDSGVTVSVLTPQVRNHHWFKYLTWITAYPAIIIPEWSRGTKNYSSLVIKNDTWIFKRRQCMYFPTQNLKKSKFVS